MDAAYVFQDCSEESRRWRLYETDKTKIRLKTYEKSVKPLQRPVENLMRVMEVKHRGGVAVEPAIPAIKQGKPAGRATRRDGKNGEKTWAGFSAESTPTGGGCRDGPSKRAFCPKIDRMLSK